MADITITIPNIYIQRLKDAIIEKNLTALDISNDVDLSTNALLLAEFKRMLKEFTSNFIKKQERKKGDREALAAVVIEDIEMELK